MKKRFKLGQKTWALFRFVLVFGLCYLILKPFITKILTVFMSPEDLLDVTVNLIPRNWSLTYWAHAWKRLNISESGLLSLRLSLISALIQVISSTMAGYGLARFKFKGRGLLFALVILIIIIPAQIYSIPQYLSFRFFGIGKFAVNLVDTEWPVYMLAAGGLAMKQGVYIYLMREFFQEMPQDLENAAAIDGASVFGTFCRIVLPNSVTMMATVFLFSFCWQWTDVNFSSRFFSENLTLAQIPTSSGLMIVRSVTGMEDRLGTAIAQNAGAILIILPLVGLAIICQKFLVQSISQSGLAN